MSEEARAAAYRQQQTDRIAWQVANAASLAGDDTLAQTVRDDWQPVIDAWRERHERDVKPELGPGPSAGYDDGV